MIKIDYQKRKNIELFKQFLPASTTLKKVLAANFLTYI